MAKQIRKKWVILWTGPALDDLREIRRYVARDKPQAARALAERIRDSVSKLRDYPNSGRVLPEFGEQAKQILHETPPHERPVAIRSLLRISFWVRDQGFGDSANAIRAVAEEFPTLVREESAHLMHVRSGSRQNRARAFLGL